MESTNKSSGDLEVNKYLQNGTLSAYADFIKSNRNIGRIVERKITLYYNSATGNYQEVTFEKGQCKQLGQSFQFIEALYQRFPGDVLQITIIQ